LGDGLTQAFGLSGIDDRLLVKEIDGREMGHGLEGRRGGVVLLGGDPPGVIGGRENVLVIFGTHGKGAMMANGTK